MERLGLSVKFWLHQENTNFKKLVVFDANNTEVFERVVQACNDYLPRIKVFPMYGKNNAFISFRDVISAETVRTLLLSQQIYVDYAKPDNDHAHLHVPPRSIDVSAAIKLSNIPGHFDTIWLATQMCTLFGVIEVARFVDQMDEAYILFNSVR